jgi:hypothetical protein
MHFIVSGASWWWHECKIGTPHQNHLDTTAVSRGTRCPKMPESPLHINIFFIIRWQ